MSKIKNLAYSLAIIPIVLIGCNRQDKKDQLSEIESIVKYDTPTKERPEWQIYHEDPCKNLKGNELYDCRINDPNTSPFYKEFLRTLRDK